MGGGVFSVRVRRRPHVASSDLPMYVEAAERLLAMFLQSQLSRSLESSWVWGAEGRGVVSEQRMEMEGGKG